MSYRGPDELHQSAPNAIVRASIVDERLVRDRLGIAFVKATDAFSTNISNLTRMDAAYDALMMFAMALFAAHGFHVSSAVKDDTVVFEGMASVLELPEKVYSGVTALCGWPNRKYIEGLNIAPWFLDASLRCIRSVITHVNAWWNSTQQFNGQRRL